MATTFAQQTRRRRNVCIPSGTWRFEPEALAGWRRPFLQVGVEHRLPGDGGHPRRLGEDTVEVEQAGVQPIVETNTARLSP
jgi:hypothetical protein